MSNPFLSRLFELEKENVRLHQENEELRAQIAKWVDLAVEGVAVREKSMLDLIVSGCLKAPADQG